MNVSNPAKHPYRIGMIVPSSNVTMETEVPVLLRRQPGHDAVGFTFHAARVRLRQVTPDALRAMNDAARDAVDLLGDAQVDAILYACLVATMYGGKAGVQTTTETLVGQARAAGTQPAVITSAGSLITALQALNARTITLIAPYRQELTRKVSQTIDEYGITVRQTHSLEVADNAAVGRLDPANLLAIASRMDLSGSDALVLSACVQMPSLTVLAEAEQRFGLPVISAATASVYTLLTSLGMEPAIPNAGCLLMHAN